MRKRQWVHKGTYYSYAKSYTPIAFPVDLNFLHAHLCYYTADLVSWYSVNTKASLMVQERQYVFK